MSMNSKTKFIIMAVSVIIMLIPTLQIRKLEQNWRNGTAEFFCRENYCTVRTYDQTLKCIKTKEINLDEIVDFKKVVDKTRARDNYASYVIMAVKYNGEEFDFFEVDTYYDTDYRKALDQLQNGIIKHQTSKAKNKNYEIKIKYPKSRTDKYSNRSY